MDDIESIILEVSAKDSSVLCREVTSIGDTMDVLRSKWVPEILTAIICGNTRFTDIHAAVHGLSDKVLTERLRQMVDDRLLEKTECYGYPPRVEYRLTENGWLLDDDCSINRNLLRLSQIQVCHARSCMADLCLYRQIL